MYSPTSSTPRHTITKDTLISDRALRERIAELREKQQEHRPWLSEQAINRAEWVIAEIEDALRDAAVEYVSTSEAARLSGWSDQTLRKHARRALANEEMEPGWELLLVRYDAGEYSFNLASIPAKGRASARRPHH
jgi:predicted transcriptional regulator